MTQNKAALKEDTRKKVKQIEARFETLRTVIAVAISLAIVMLIISFISDEPVYAIKTLLIGPLTNIRQFGNVIILMIPLTFTGLATAIVFQSNRFNLASSSAFYAGSMAAALVGLYSPLPAFPTIVLALLAGFVSGAVIGFIPAILNKQFGASELVVSLMLNYIIGFFVLFLFINVIRNPQASVLESSAIQTGVSLGVMFKLGRVNIHWGFFLVLLLTAIAYLVIYRTRWGYALRSTGNNEKFAKYVGLKVSVIVLISQVIGVALAGLGGAVEMLGNHRTFKWAAAPSYGFDGVILAALARNNPLYVPLAAFFLAYIRIGADMISLTSDVPAEIISVVQAAIIILISAKSFLSSWKQKSIVKASIATAVQKEEV